MLAEFEDLWASGKSSPRPGPSSASQPQLIIPLVVVPAPIASVVLGVIVAASVATVLGSSRSAASSARFV